MRERTRFTIAAVLILGAVLALAVWAGNGTGVALAEPPSTPVGACIQGCLDWCVTSPQDYKLCAAYCAAYCHPKTQIPPP